MSLLGSNVVLIMPRRRDQMYFSRFLRPWVHYLPIDIHPEVLDIDKFKQGVISYRFNDSSTLPQMSNLAKIVEWANNNEDIVFQINRNANKFFEEHMSNDAIECYLRGIVEGVARVYTFNAQEKISESLKRLIDDKAGNATIISRNYDARGLFSS